MFKLRQKAQCVWLVARWTVARVTIGLHLDGLLLRVRAYSGDRSSYELCLAGSQNALRLHASWAHRVYTVHTLCAQPATPCHMCFCGCVADAAGARAEGVLGSKCVLLEILHPHVQEQAAESLQLARYGPAKMGGLAGVRERRGRSALA